jgi:hypothetical protein
MTAHEYLSLYLALEKDIQRWERTKIKLQALDSEEYLDGVLRATANYSGLPGSSSVQDKIGAAVSRKCDHDSGRDMADLNSKIEKAKDKMIEIASSIDEVPYNMCRQVLDLRYLQGMSMNGISEETTDNPSTDTIRRWIKQGLSWISASEVDGVSMYRKKEGSTCNDLQPFASNCNHLQ